MINDLHFFRIITVYVSLVNGIDTNKANTHPLPKKIIVDIIISPSPGIWYVLFRVRYQLFSHGRLGMIIIYENSVHNKTLPIVYNKRLLH